MQVLYKIIYWFFMSAVVGLGALLMVSLIPISGLQVKIVKSGSMEPAIKTGSIVVDHPAASYVVGDVITFGADTKTQVPTTHRIVATEGVGSAQTFQTKGDANNTPDPSLTPLSAVHGKVILTIPYLGYLLDFARKPLGFALLVGVPAVFIILEEVGKIVREVLRMRRRKNISHAIPIKPQIYRQRPRVE